MVRILTGLQRFLSTLFLLCLVNLVVSGLLAENPWFHGIHRWSAHGLVIYAWLVVPVAIAARYGEGKGTWKIVALLVFVVLGLLHTSFTGYLGPMSAAEYGEQLSEETKNRFMVIHMFLQPAILIAMATIWMWLAWRISPVRPSQKHGAAIG